MKKLATTIVCLIALLAATPTLADATAASPDSVQVYAFMANTSTLDQDDGYHQFDWGRGGVRTYKGHFMFRLEYDYVASAVKYCYVEYRNTLGDWTYGVQDGKHLLPTLYNFPAPSVQPMPTKGDAYYDLSIRGTGLCGYLSRGIFRAHLSWSQRDDYSANVKVGALSAFWTKREAQGLALKKSFNRWLNIYSVWTNYEDWAERQFPDRRNAAFVENHCCFGDRVRVYLHQDFGDFRGSFIGGISYMLYPSDKECTIGAFYDSENQWQARLTFGLKTTLY